MNLPQLILGILFAAIVAYVAYRLKTLDRGGALAAFLLGAVVFGLGGMAWAIVLLTFFITSSGLSRLFKQRKYLVEEKFSKGSRRDAGQVAANGGVAGLAVLLSVFFPGLVFPWIVFAAALAAANADTWATELGVLSRFWPRNIRTWQRVAPGSSGAVSLTGTLAATAGSLIIAIIAYMVWPVPGTSASSRLIIVLIILFSGLIGSLVDSFLGATVQAIFWCPVCKKETEKSPTHTCGSPTTMIRGWKWMNNDLVNFLCTTSGASTAIVAYLLYQVIG